MTQVAAADAGITSDVVDSAWRRRASEWHYTVARFVQPANHLKLHLCLYGQIKSPSNLFSAYHAIITQRRRPSKRRHQSLPATRRYQHNSSILTLSISSLSRMYDGDTSKVKAKLNYTYFIERHIVWTSEVLCKRSENNFPDVDNDILLEWRSGFSTSRSPLDALTTVLMLRLYLIHVARIQVYPLVWASRTLLRTCIRVYMYLV